MKRMTISFSLLVFTLFAFSSGIADEAENGDWKAFSKNLKKALQSQNTGLKASALHHIIWYGDKVDIGDGVFEILRIYRDHEDLHMRRLALAALPKTGSRLAIGFLRNAVEFEESPVLKRQIQFILIEDAKK